MKRSRLLLILPLAVWGLLSNVIAATGADDVEVQDAYVRAVPPGLTNSASFMTLVNHSEHTHELVSADSPAAKFVELHEHVHKDGMMMMRKVAEVTIPAGAKTLLQPGGLHLMLIGLTQELMPGKDVAITLVFKDGSRKEIQAPVRKLMMKMPKR